MDTSDDMQSLHNPLYSDIRDGCSFDEPPLFPANPTTDENSVYSECSATSQSSPVIDTPSSHTRDTRDSTPVSNLEAFLPTLLSRIGQLVWPLESLVAPPPETTPLCYSAILPFALRNTDQLTVAPIGEGEPTDEREVRYRKWCKEQEQSSAYDHWLTRGQEACVRRLQYSNSRSSARQATYMQRRRQCTPSSTTTTLVASPLRYRLDGAPTYTSGTGFCKQILVASREVDADEREGSDESWGDDWDESFSLSSEDYGESDTSQEENGESTSRRGKPIPLDERYSLIYGSSVVYGPRAASLMGFPESSWALWLPSENEGLLGADMDLNNKSLRELETFDVLSAPLDEVPFPEPSLVHVDMSSVIPSSATRLAARAHSGKLRRRPRPCARTRAAAGSHLKLAAWVLTTIKLDDTEMTVPSGTFERCQASQSIGRHESATQAPALAPSTVKRAREEEMDEDDGTLLRQDSSRPMKRIHL